MWLVPIVASFFSVEVQDWGGGGLHVIKVCFYSFVVFYPLYFLISLIPYPRVETSLKNTLLILSLIFAFVDFFASWYFHMGFTPSLVSTLLNTNLRESHEFLMSYILPNLGVLATYILFCVAFLFLVRFKIHVQTKLNLKILLALFVAFWVHNLGAYIPREHHHGALINPNIPTRIMPIIKEFYAIGVSLKEYKQTKYKNLKQSYPKDYLSVDLNSVSNVVLIVGESASKNFMGVYGYPVANTPFLSDLSTKGHLFIFKDVISAFANTYAVFKTLLNYADVENSSNPEQQKNLGSIFKLAGYKTFWFDSQDDLEKNRAFDFWSTPFMKRYYSNGFFKADGATLDAWLISAFNKQKSQLSSKNFILFHLIGSHAGYKYRFPKSYAKFMPTDIPYQNLHVQNNKDRQVVADYVNSLYYTDHILGEIFKLFKDKDALIIYLSDHAQDIFQSGNTYGHKCSAYGVEIPFMIYVSEVFKQKHPEKLKLIAKAINKPFMSDDLIHSLLPLVGIHTKDNLESKNLFSPAFDTNRKRVYCDHQVYEKKPSANLESKP
ncbi:phosphoethanolamine transferase [Helicobacter suis]|uniref:phosphoethanolamine transferase n=1 Tax=Helicobacter suis TaxID=104628 RepID=UPI0013D3FB9D